MSEKRWTRGERDANSLNVIAVSDVRVSRVFHEAVDSLDIGDHDENAAGQNQEH